MDMRNVTLASHLALSQDIRIIRLDQDPKVEREKKRQPSSSSSTSSSSTGYSEKEYHSNHQSQKRHKTCNKKRRSRSYKRSQTPSRENHEHYQKSHQPHSYENHQEYSHIHQAHLTNSYNHGNYGYYTENYQRSSVERNPCQDSHEEQNNFSDYDYTENDATRHSPPQVSTPAGIEHNPYQRELELPPSSPEDMLTKIYYPPDSALPEILPDTKEILFSFKTRNMVDFNWFQLILFLSE